MAVEFLNVFLVPIISLVIYTRRFNKSMGWDVITFARWAIFSVVDTIVTYIMMKVLEFSVGIGAEISSQLYTIIACAVAFLLPYIVEFYKKYIDIRLEIKDKKQD